MPETLTSDSSRIEDYAIIGNCETVALISRSGSIDWLGLPRFDSPACFASLLGTTENGRWIIAPVDGEVTVTRRYQGATLVLETDFETDSFLVRLTDFMTRRDGVSDIIRLVRCLRGDADMRTELVARFDYGRRIPWVQRLEDGRLQLAAGGERLLLDSPIELRGESMRTLGEFRLREGEEARFLLSWTPSYHPLPASPDPDHALASVQAGWAKWVGHYTNHDPWSEQVLRSLVTLKALAHWETGGIVAAGTTSLPEWLGGQRNWDYRFCWLRDATFTLYALIGAGFLGEAQAWRDWLLRAAAGNPDDLQIMYGVAGESRLTEYEIPWLPGFHNSSPVRIGNEAANQLQLDVYGEVIDAFYVARKAGLEPNEAGWRLACALVSHLAKIWDQPDDGIWEVRGGRRHFTHSKVMCWVALDRVIRSVEEFGLDGPVEEWRELRAHIHAEVCAHGFSEERNSFVQSFGDSALDASTLLIPLVGFLPATDARVLGTVAAIERELLHDGFVLRYRTEEGKDGLPPGEGVFLACSFWLADCYVLLGRIGEAQALFERLLRCTNDVGLLAEEYDPRSGRQLGNFPQALSHLALINTAHNLSRVEGPGRQRAQDCVAPQAAPAPAGSKVTG